MQPDTPKIPPKTRKFPCKGAHLWHNGVKKLVQPPQFASVTTAAKQAAPAQPQKALHGAQVLRFARQHRQILSCTFGHFGRLIEITRAAGGHDLTDEYKLQRGFKASRTYRLLP